MGLGPQARRDGVIAEPREDGVILYDLDALRAHRLGMVAADVWQAADGSLSTAGLAAATGVGETAVRRALDQLESLGMLAEEPLLAHRAAALAAWG